VNSTENPENQLIQIRIDHRVRSGFMILMLIANVLVFSALWKDIRSGRNDFPIFYSNAQMVREGRAADMYDFDAENSFVLRVSDVPRVRLNHVPYELLLFIPFTYLRFVPAYVLWALLCIGMLACVVFIMRRIKPSESSFLFTYLSVVTFFPVAFCLLTGQDSILLLLIFTLSFWFWKRGRDDAAGFALAFGLFRPQLVLPFVLIAFLARKWKFVRGFVPGAVLVFALSVCVVGFHGFVHYVGILVSLGSEKSQTVLDAQWTIKPGRMATWRGFLTVCLPAGMPSWISTFLLLCGTFAGLSWAASTLRRAKNSASFDGAFAISVAVVALTSFHSFLNDFSLLILPLLIFGSLLAPPRYVPRRDALLVVTLGFIFFLTPVYMFLLLTDSLGWLLPVELFALWLLNRIVGSVPCLRWNHALQECVGGGIGCS
jgi:hypothetical protein